MYGTPQALIWLAILRPLQRSRKKLPRLRFKLLWVRKGNCRGHDDLEPFSGPKRWLFWAIWISWFPYLDLGGVWIWKTHAVQTSATVHRWQSGQVQVRHKKLSDYLQSINLQIDHNMSGCCCAGTTSMSTTRTWSSMFKILSQFSLSLYSTMQSTLRSPYVFLLNAGKIVGTGNLLFWAGTTEVAQAIHEHSHHFFAKGGEKLVAVWGVQICQEFEKERAFLHLSNIK